LLNINIKKNYATMILVAAYYSRDIFEKQIIFK